VAAKSKHGRNTLGNYLSIHRKVLEQYQAGSPNPKIYKERRLTENYLSLDVFGVRITTKKGNIIKVKIEKDAEVNTTTGKRPTAKTTDYSYHAYYSDGRNIIRYCSPHPYHNQFHHKHDYINGKVNPPIKIAPDDVPHVSEFFDELINHY
jgi:hypothetical protein